MYTTTNFKTKKALKEAIARGDKVGVCLNMLGTTVAEGEVSVEGPHFPKPLTWYATATLKNGVVIKVV